MHLQPAVVADKAQFPKSVHKEVHAGADCTDYFRQSRLIDLWDHSLRPVLLAKTGEC